MTPEQLKLADKIEGWSPEKWKPLTLTAHERRFAVAALRATPDARVKEALEALDNSQSLLAMIYHLNTKGCVEEHDWEGEGLGDLIQKQIAENRAALSHQPGTGEAGGVPDRETFWLVERIGHQQYVKDRSELPALTSDPWRAVRFVTEREAHDFWLRLATLRDECKPVEHMFINKGAPSPALEPAAVEAAFLNLCEALGIPATAAAYLDAPKARAALTAKEGA